MNRRELLACSGAVLGAFAGCVSAGENNSGVPSPGLQIGTDVDQEDVDALIRGNTTFALDFHDAIVTEEPDANHVVSPLSISIALAMTWAGARGETETQMADVLHFPHEQEELHPTMGSLLTALDERVQDAGDDELVDGLLRGDEDALELAIANRLWPHEGLDVREDFLETVAVNYAAEPQRLDFAGDPAGSRTEINARVSDQTHERIDELLPSGSIKSKTRLVLTNAIYFLADWHKQFDPDDTTEESFTALDGTTEQVPMMSQTGEFPYVRVDGHQVIELPYVGEELSMVVILPVMDEFEEFESALTADRLSELFDELDEADVDLSLPRFELETDYSLQTVLKDLGMPAAFEGGFEGIVEGGGIWIDDVYHDAFIAVDEEGTEAAAATGVTMEESAPPSMTVDHPFLFLIRDRPTDSVLFFGRMVTPPDDS